MAGWDVHINSLCTILYKNGTNTLNGSLTELGSWMGTVSLEKAYTTMILKI